MIRSFRVLAFLAALLTASLAISPRVFAHHSGAPLDRTREVTLQGEVKEWRWTNPHSALFFYAPDEKGERVVWTVEGTSPGILVKQGWTKTIVKPGDRVTVVFWPLRDGGHGGGLIRVILADGAVLGPKPAAQQ